MSSWLKGIVGCMLLVNVALQMLPDRKYEQYVKLFAGFLMILLVLRPILRIGSVNTYLENRIAAFLQEQEELERQIGTESRRFQEKSEEAGESVQEDQERIVIEEIEKIRVEVTEKNEKTE